MKQVLGALLAVSLLAASCQKELSIEKNQELGPDLLAYFEARQPAPQKFTVQSGSQSLIEGQKGTRLVFPAHAFVTQSGAPVSGAVDIEFKEVYEVWEMVLHNKFTQVGRTPIESGGQFFLRATQNGQELKVASGVSLTAVLPTQNPLPGMQVFNGNRFDSAGQSIFSWTLASDPAANSVLLGQDTLGVRNYIMQFNELNWINCDRFLSEPIAEMQARIANYVSGEEPIVLLHLTGRKSIMYVWKAGGRVYKNLAPEGAPGTFIAFSNRDGQLYATFQAVQLQSGQEYPLTLAPMPEEEFQQRLRSLN
jgi:hypothetical protein